MVSQDRRPVLQGRRGLRSATGRRGDEKRCSWQSSSVRQEHDVRSQRHEKSGLQVQRLPTHLKMQWSGSSLKSKQYAYLRELEFAGLNLEGLVGDNSAGICQRSWVEWQSGGWVVFDNHE